MSEVLEPLAPKFGDTPSIPICNRLQPIGKFGVATVLQQIWMALEKYDPSAVQLVVVVDRAA